MMAVAWRVVSAVARLRADPITALAPLSHMLISGFFFIQGFLMSSRLNGKSRVSCNLAAYAERLCTGRAISAENDGTNKAQA
jgi:hypothetical protein